MKPEERAAILKSRIREEKIKLVKSHCDQGINFQTICAEATAISKGQAIKSNLTSQQLIDYNSREEDWGIAANYLRCQSLGLLAIDHRESLPENPIKNYNQVGLDTSPNSVTAPNIPVTLPVPPVAIIDPKELKQAVPATDIPKDAPVAAADMPGTHPMAVDSSGVPIPPPQAQTQAQAYPTSNASYSPPTATPIAAPPPPVDNAAAQIIQNKLDQAQAKLATLNDSINQEKINSEKQKQQKIADDLQKEIDRLKAEKAAITPAPTLISPATSVTPATTSGLTASQAPVQATAPMVEVKAAVRNEENNTVTTSAPQKNISAGKKEDSDAGATGGIKVVSSGSAPGTIAFDVVINDFKEIPSVVLEGFKKFKLEHPNSEEAFPFIAQNGNFQIIDATDPVTGMKKPVMVPLLKKKVVVNVKAEKKIAAKQTPKKREFYLKDLKTILKSEDK